MTGTLEITRKGLDGHAKEFYVSELLGREYSRNA